MKNEKKAFTLAEILISLTIIGIIAAITVPAVIQRTNKQELVAQLQKTYSTLSQAVNQIIAEEGLPYGEEGWASSSKKTADLMKKYLIHVQECSTQAERKKCFVVKYKNLNTGARVDRYGSNGSQRFMLADSASIYINGSTIVTDINTGSKGPNQLGRDVFYFNLSNEGIKPAGCENENSCEGTEGFGCACKVLKEGAMNY